MVKTILVVFSLVLAVFGLSEVIYIIRMFFCYPGVRCCNYVVVFLKKKYAIKQLNFIWQKIRWYGNSYANGIIALTDCLDFDEISNCNKFILEKNIILCDLQSLSQCQCLQGDF